MPSNTLVRDLAERRPDGRKPPFERADAWAARQPVGRLGRPDEAEATFRRALELQPDSAELKFGLSVVKLLLGDYESGLALFENRLEKDALPQAAYGALQARLKERGFAYPELRVDLIGYSSVAFLSPETKALAIAPRGSQRFVDLNLQTLRSRDYPLADEVYFYVRKEPGKHSYGSPGNGTPKQASCSGFACSNTWRHGFMWWNCQAW